MLRWCGSRGGVRREAYIETRNPADVFASDGSTHPPMLEKLKQPQKDHDSSKPRLLNDIMGT